MALSEEGVGRRGRSREPAVVAGTLHGGLPMIRVGSGPPLLVLAGLTPEHRNPTGFDQRMQLRSTAAFAEHFSVYLVNRRPGLPAGTTMTDLAEDLATAIRHDIQGPVMVQGTSTGGFIALQLVLNHPELVSRAVIASAACRLSDPGRRALTRFAERARIGRPRRAWAALAPAIGTGPVTRRLMAPLLAANVGSGTDPADMLATAEAGLAFDVTGELARISVPTLVIGGGRDGFFSPELFRETADGIPAGDLVLDPRKGHLGVLVDQAVQRRTLQFLRSV